MSWVSQAAYSSAVRLASVRRRNCATSLSPSNTANLELVLPTSMASSIARSPSGRAGQQLAGHDPARAGGVSSSKAPSRSMPAKRPRTSSSPSFTSTSRPSGPALASHAARTASKPSRRHCGQTRRASAAVSLSSAASTVPPRQAPRIAHLGQLRREADIDADAQHDVLDLAALRRSRSRAGCRRPCRRRPARRSAISPARRGRPARCRPPPAPPRSPARPRAPPGSRAAGSSSCRDCRPARPSAAAPAAAAGLLARPDDGAFGRAGLGQARGLVVGAADALQRDQRPPVRQDGRGCHGNRPLAAAAAIRLSGCGASENTATSSAGHEGHGAVDAERPAGRAPRCPRRSTSP